MTLKNRLAKLEAKRAAGTLRVIILEDDKYIERGKEISEAEYQTMENDPACDVLLVKIVRASEATIDT